MNMYEIMLKIQQQKKYWAILISDHIKCCISQYKCQKMYKLWLLCPHGNFQSDIDVAVDRAFAYLFIRYLSHTFHVPGTISLCAGN